MAGRVGVAVWEAPTVGERTGAARERVDGGLGGRAEADGRESPGVDLVRLVEFCITDPIVHSHTAQG